MMKQDLLGQLFPLPKSSDLICRSAFDDVGETWWYSKDHFHVTLIRNTRAAFTPAALDINQGESNECTKCVKLSHIVLICNLVN